MEGAKIAMNYLTFVDSPNITEFLEVVKVVVMKEKTLSGSVESATRKPIQYTRCKAYGNNQR